MNEGMFEQQLLRALSLLTPLKGLSDMKYGHTWPAMTWIITWVHLDFSIFVNHLDVYKLQDASVFARV